MKRITKKKAFCDALLSHWDELEERFGCAWSIPGETWYERGQNSMNCMAEVLEGDENEDVIALVEYLKDMQSLHDALYKEYYRLVGREGD